MTENGFQSSFFELHQDGPIAVATINREQLTDDENLEQMDQDLAQVLGDEPGRSLICDLSHVKYMNSSAIGKFISLHRRAIRHKSMLILCGLQTTVRDILATSHLLQYFSTSQDAQTALDELS